MNRQTTLTIAVFLTLVSCKKEKFPDKDNLIGSWTEQISNSFKHKLVFDAETMFFFKLTSVDTLSYHLDKKTGLLLLALKNNSSAGVSSHKILVNGKSNVLTIFGLFPTVDNETETKFKKE